MKRNNVLFTVLAILLVASFVFSGCMKDSLDEDTTIATDNAIVESIFNDAQIIADQASDGKLTSYIPEYESSILSGCATITIDLTKSPKSIIVDFGTTNCLCADNRERRGKILITFTSGYRDSGAVITHTFDNYFVNDHQVKGLRIVTNNGRNSNGFLNYTIDVDGVVIKPNGDSIQWKSLRANEWIAGDKTLTIWDDVYLISGSATGISSTGVNYSLNITKDLRKEIGYKHFVSGVLEITPAGKLTRILDYGDGTRDDKATVTIAGRTFNIILN